MARVVKRSLAVGLGLVFFLMLYPLKLAKYFYERLTQQPATCTGMAQLYAEVFCTIEEALKIFLPGAQDIKEEVKVLTAEQRKIIQQKSGVELHPEFDKEFHFYVSSGGAAVLDTVQGKWGPIKFMMAVDNTGKIKDLIVLELKEKRGRPVKERKFLEQYIGKSTTDPIKLKKDIKGIAGATISSRQMTNGIRKLVYIYEELYRK